jgi:SAM-dependent methyltransferase
VDGIRAHTAPRTAVVWAVLNAELNSRPGVALDVLDVGGGTGGFAVPLAQAGHRVTVVDASPDALAALDRRATEAEVAGRVRAVQGDADKLTDVAAPATADLVLCHSVLEVVDSPEVAADAIATVLRPGGVASVLVANRAAAVLTRALGGHLGAARALLDDPAGRAGGKDTLRRRFDVAGAESLLTGAGLRVEQIHGVRVVADLVPGALLDAEPGGYDALLGFETRTAALAPYRDIATALHFLARRP